MGDPDAPAAQGYPKFPGDAIVPQRLPSERVAPLEDPILAPPSLPKPKKQLTAIDLLICVMLPLVGVIVGAIRFIRGDSTGLRMFLISVCFIVVYWLQRGCFMG